MIPFLFTLDGCTKASVVGKPEDSAAAVKLERIQTSPASMTLRKDTGAAFRAFAIYSDKHVEEVTQKATWSSQSPDLASFDDASQKSLVQAHQTGTVKIQAKYQDLVGSSNLTITSPSLTQLLIQPASLQLYKGISQQLTVLGVYADGSTTDLTSLATWSTSAPQFVDLQTDNKGRVVGVAIGSSQITAKYSGQQASIAIAVVAGTLSQIELTPPVRTLPVGQTQSYVAIGQFSDGALLDLSNDVTWTVTASDVASFGSASASKTVTALAAGSTQIQATYGALSAQAALTVTTATLQAIEIGYDEASFPKGAKVQLSAEALYSDGTTEDVTQRVLWSSSQAHISVDLNGLATGVSPGSSDIVAALGDQTDQVALTVVDTALTSLTIVPSSLKIPVGFHYPFQALGQYADGTELDLSNQVIWSSDTPSLLSISNLSGQAGVALSGAAGQAIVKAELTQDSGSSISGQSTVEVTQATLQTIEVSPVSKEIPKGATFGFKAIGHFSDQSSLEITKDVSWTVSKPTLAQTSNDGMNKGKVWTLLEGSVTLEAKLNALKGSASITVTAPQLLAVGVTLLNHSVAKGVPIQASAVATYTDGSTQAVTGQVTWTLGDSSIAKISASESGKIDTLIEGTTTVSASLGDLSSKPLRFTVTEKELNSIQINLNPTTFVKGTVVSASAIGTFSDGSTGDLTSLATWTSSNTGIALIGTLANNQIQIDTTHTSQAGTTSLNVSYRKSSTNSIPVTTSLPITVTPKQITAIAITLDPGSVTQGNPSYATADAVYSDQTHGDVTSTVTWMSSDPTIATIGSLSGNKMTLVTSNATQVGPVQISAKGKALPADPEISSLPVTLITTDAAPPRPGTLSFSLITSNSMTVSWSAANDDITGSSTLQYKLVRANTSDLTGKTITELDAIPAGGGLEMDWTTNTLFMNVTGLASNSTYFFAVLVKDAAGNIARYSPQSKATLAMVDTTPPSVGTITFDTPTSTSVTVNWSAASDLVTAPADLQYKLVSSTNSSTIDTLTGADGSAASIVMPWTKNVLSQQITGLVMNSTYYFAVVVKDAAGNKAAYAAQSVTTAGPKKWLVTSTKFSPGTTGGDPIARADKLCNDTVLAGSKALLASSNRKVGNGNGWIFKPYTTYINSTGAVIVTTDSQGTWGKWITLQNPVTPVSASVAVWTGLDADWNVSQNCSDWTSNGIGLDNSSLGTLGSSGQTTGPLFLIYVQSNCATSYNLYCIEQ